MARRNKWRSAVRSSCRRPKANRTKPLLQACRSTLKLWPCGGPVFAAKAPIVCGRGQRGGDASRTIRTKRSKLLLTPHYKLAPQEPRTGVAEPWPSNKASARTRLIGCGRVISSNPTFRKLSNYLVMRNFWRSGPMTQDYKRNGTTTLFAALEVAQGKVVGQCFARHRNREFLKFLRRLDQEFPGEIPLHLVMDNYGTHKHPNVQAWLKKHPRFLPHYVPTSSSWLNLVERWFSELTSKRIRRGTFLSVPDLITAIEEFMDTWNRNPKPFCWTTTVDSIVEKLQRCRQTLENIQPGCTLPRSRKRRKKY